MTELVIENLPPHVKDRPGVYCFVFKSGKFYVGSSLQIRTRLQNHLSFLRKGRHTDKLQATYNKHGEPTRFLVLAFTEADDALLKETENLFLKMWDRARYLNINDEADRPSWKPETRAKASESAKLRYSDPDQRARHLAAMTSEEYRRRQSEAAKLRWSDPEQRAKVSANNSMKNPEARAKVSEAAKRQWSDPVKKARYLAAMTSEEFRTRQSQSVKAWWARRKAAFARKRAEREAAKQAEAIA